MNSRSMARGLRLLLLLGLALLVSLAAALMVSGIPRNAAGMAVKGRHSGWRSAGVCSM